MIPFSGLSRFSGLFGGDGPCPLNRDTTVVGKPNDADDFDGFIIKLDESTWYAYGIKTRT